MKRLHVHIAVEDLETNVRFYSAMFAAEPTVLKDDYAKWLLDDPRVNFAISARGAIAGLNHLGMQVESAEALDDMRQRLDSLKTQVIEQVDAACCYAKSDKYWVADPQDVRWETFHTLDSIPVFGVAENSAGQAADGCCVPDADTDGPACNATRSSPRSGCC